MFDFQYVHKALQPISMFLPINLIETEADIMFRSMGAGQAKYIVSMGCLQKQSPAQRGLLYITDIYFNPSTINSESFVII